MAKPGEQEDDLTLDEGTQNGEGLETETDADGADSEDPEDGADAEGTAEGDGADAQEGQVDEPRRPSRGEVRFQTLSRTAKEATERATKAEQHARELDARLARIEQPQQQDRAKTNEELALMTPDELIEYRLGTATKSFEQRLGQIQWATYEAGDKAAFNSLKATDPMAVRYGDEVEQRLAEMRKSGQNVDRERLLTFIIGEKVRQKNGGAKKIQQAAGQKRIQSQTVRPGAQRSDTPSNRGRMSEQEARDKRLENMTF